MRDWWRLDGAAGAVVASPAPWAAVLVAASIASAVQELVDVGLVALDTAARVIRLDLHEGLLSREEQRPSDLAADVAPRGGPRRKPSDTAERARDRKVRHQFAHRLGPFAAGKVEIPDGATWESWSSSPAGVAFLSARNAPGTPQGTPQGTRSGTPENAPERPRNAPNSSLRSATLLYIISIIGP
jgi:hypothetical protein